MKCLKYSAGLALAVVGVLGLASPMLAGEPVPFPGTLDGDVTHTSVDPQTDFVIVEATGTATIFWAGSRWPLRTSRTPPPEPRPGTSSRRPTATR